jgi:ZIP family zinc transporter
LAVGVGFGSGDIGSATSLAIGIGLQNMPEGLAVALPLLGLGYSRLKAIGIATLTRSCRARRRFVGYCICQCFSPCFTTRPGLCRRSHAFCYQ